MKPTEVEEKTGTLNLLNETALGRMRGYRYQMLARHRQGWYRPSKK